MATHRQLSSARSTCTDVLACSRSVYGGTCTVILLKLLLWRSEATAELYSVLNLLENKEGWKKNSRQTHKHKHVFVCSLNVFSTLYCRLSIRFLRSRHPSSRTKPLAQHEPCASFICSLKPPTISALLNS